MVLDPEGLGELRQLVPVPDGNNEAVRIGSPCAIGTEQTTVGGNTVMTTEGPFAARLVCQ